MRHTPATMKGLDARLNRLEADTEAARQEAIKAGERAARAEEQAARLAERLPAVKRGNRGVQASTQEPKRMSRAGFLKRGGAIVAGAAGAVLLEAHGSRDAYAGTDTNFVATGIPGGGGVGYLATPLTVTGGFDRGVDVAGRQYGGNFSGIGSGVPLRLSPSTIFGPPTTGQHQVGELYVDISGRKWSCVSTGTPGSWKSVLDIGISNGADTTTFLFANPNFAGPLVLGVDASAAPGASAFAADGGTNG